MSVEFSGCMQPENGTGSMTGRENRPSHRKKGPLPARPAMDRKFRLNYSFVILEICPNRYSVPGSIFTVLLHQSSITKQLLERVYPQLAVDIFIMVAQGTLLDACNGKDFLDIFP